ncbi:hypothetical protein K0M31_009436 [Melipona bicolor]|uniref:Uncharacterized protein n=1 Tax=Melipona bicolor TaxID=60889 RepID=A0AA40KJ23_9HYME|nr:hypothetical protein K0M31_009436 [Melipona bicolor]
MVIARGMQRMIRDAIFQIISIVKRYGPGQPFSGWEYDEFREERRSPGDARSGCIPWLCHWKIAGILEIGAARVTAECNGITLVPATCSNCLVFRAIFLMFDADRPISVSVTTRDGGRGSGN